MGSDNLKISKGIILLNPSNSRYEKSSLPKQIVLFKYFEKNYSLQNILCISPILLNIVLFLSVLRLDSQQDFNCISRRLRKMVSFLTYSINCRENFETILESLLYAVNDPVYSFNNKFTYSLELTTSSNGHFIHQTKLYGKREFNGLHIKTTVPKICESFRIC